MNHRSRLTVFSVTAAMTVAAIGCIGHAAQPESAAIADSVTADTLIADTLSPQQWEGGKAQMPLGDEDVRYKTLTDADFEVVARELSVEVAAIKAVVRIEAGRAMEGFWAPGVPVVNFDRSMYNTYAKKAVSKAGDKSAKVPSGLKGFALKKWTTLTNMRRVNKEGADMGTFWGMFQIGGFAYRQCGCNTIGEFVKLMSRSEFDQLELFAAFVLNTGYVEYIRKKDWASFARRYNGPSYAKRGYHTRMAREYSKFKKSDLSADGL